MSVIARVSYDDATLLAAARARYFEANGFGADGGYGKRWEIVRLGPVPVPILNTAARVRAIRFHDLHHVLTGYATDVAGEAEISAWELASGCANMPFAFAINIQGLLLGVLRAPRRTLAAWARGRRTANLYRDTFSDELLARTVGAERARLGLDAPDPAPTTRDKATFALLAGASILGHIVPFAAALAWLLA